ncbi:MAG: cation:proton antiporter [Planctomycetaceae bacterium]|nr:cation:proton antiporter [Planctomycetaceae bacterium]
MTDLPVLIQDLGLILMAAAVMTLLFKALKQPIVLGYLIAGFLVSPYVPYLPTVQDEASIHIWAEIGVIFMLFGLGLEFSFKKLTKVGKTVLITGIFEIIFVINVGFVTGRLLGWSRMDSLFLGAILSMSSTTIIVKVFEDRALKGRSFVPVVFGVLIVEDLIAILLLVLLSSIAATQSLSGLALLISSIRLVFFLMLWFILGIYLLPLFLKKCRHLLSDETLLIVSVGLCLMMVIIACYVGFSPALGAFVMGSILSETSRGTKIEHLTLPVKDLFSAVFFVSVGMLIDPMVLRDYFGIIILITIITIVGKFFGTGLGALISGSSLKNSTQAGMSMAQIGEFSFIIATLGMTLHVTSACIYPITVAVSAVTTFTTPYLIQFAEPFSNWLLKWIPARAKHSLARYEYVMATRTEKNIFSLFWKEHGIKIVLNSVIVIGITLAVSYITSARAYDRFPQINHTVINILVCFATLIVSGPFFRGIFRCRPPRPGIYDSDMLVRLEKLKFGATLFRFLVGSTLVCFMVSRFVPLSTLTGILLLISAAVTTFLISHLFEPIYKRLESIFVTNLSEKELLLIQEKAVHPELAPWDVSLTEFTMSQYSPLVMKTLKDSGLKDGYGVIVAMIERNGKRITAPGSHDVFLPCDTVFLIGTDEQLLAVREIIETKEPPVLSKEDDDFGLMSFLLKQGHPFVDKSIRDCGLREASNGLIVGLERKGKRFLNPNPAMTLLAGDLIWVVSGKKAIEPVFAMTATKKS